MQDAECRTRNLMTGGKIAQQTVEVRSCPQGFFARSYGRAMVSTGPKISSRTAGDVAVTPDISVGA